MKIIRAYSYKCADNLTKKLNDNNEKRRLYYYSFQIIIGGIFKFILLIILALLTGTFIETFTVLAFFAGLRVVAGGYHMDDYTNCMVTSFAMFIGIGLIVKYTHMGWTTLYLAVFSAAAFLIALFAAAKYAPADTPFKPLNNPSKRKRLKIMSIVETFLWLVLDIFLIIKGYKMSVLAGCFGMLMAAFIISPAGYSFYGFISTRMHKLRKRASAR